MYSSTTQINTSDLRQSAETNDVFPVSLIIVLTILSLLLFVGIPLTYYLVTRNQKDESVVALGAANGIKNEQLPSNLKIDAGLRIAMLSTLNPKSAYTAEDMQRMRAVYLKAVNLTPEYNPMFTAIKKQNIKEFLNNKENEWMVNGIKKCDRWNQAATSINQRRGVDVDNTLDVNVLKAGLGHRRWTSAVLAPPPVQPSHLRAYPTEKSLDKMAALDYDLALNAALEKYIRRHCSPMKLTRKGIVTASHT